MYLHTELSTELYEAKNLVFPMEFSPAFIFTSAPDIVIVVSFRPQQLNACQTKLMRLLLLLLHRRILIFISYEDSNQSQANSA